MCSQGVSYPTPDEVNNPDWIDSTRVLLVDGEAGEGGDAASRLARQHGVDVVVDVEQDYPHSTAILEAASHTVISNDFAFQYTGKSTVPDVLQALKTSDDQTVIITRGKAGCTGLIGSEVFELLAFIVDVVDTTGCGDVFHGSYALAIARGFPVLEAARYASAAAALCATKFGGRPGIPTENDLNDFLDAHTV